MNVTPRINPTPPHPNIDMWRHLYAVQVYACIRNVECIIMLVIL
jgi:hypothetical protein